MVQMEAIQGLDPDCGALIAYVWSIVCSTCSMDSMSVISQIRMDIEKDGAGKKAE